MIVISNGLMGTRHDLALRSLTMKAARNDIPRRAQESLGSYSPRYVSREVGFTGVICKTAVAYVTYATIRCGVRVDGSDLPPSS
jgi:hypothetical protein